MFSVFWCYACLLYLDLSWCELSSIDEFSWGAMLFVISAVFIGLMFLQHAFMDQSWFCLDMTLFWQSKLSARQLVLLRESKPKGAWCPIKVLKIPIANIISQRIRNEEPWSTNRTVFSEWRANHPPVFPFLSSQQVQHLEPIWALRIPWMIQKRPIWSQTSWPTTAPTCQWKSWVAKRTRIEDDWSDSCSSTRQVVGIPVRQFHKFDIICLSYDHTLIQEHWSWLMWTIVGWFTINKWGLSSITLRGW